MPEPLTSEQIETLVRGELARLEIPFEVIVCRPDQADTAVFCEVFGIAPEASVNTILVASKKQPKVYAACLVLATTRLDVNHAVRRLMSVKRLSFASAEQTMELTGMMVGGVTPFGLPEGLPLYIDRRVMGRPSVVIGGGSRSCKIRLAPAVLEKLPQAHVVDDLALPVV